MRGYNFGNRHTFWLRRSVVAWFYEEIAGSKGGSQHLKKVAKYQNLAHTGFRQIFQGWWGSETPPDLEIDLVLVFEDAQKLVDDALIIGIEVEYIQDRTKNFYIGLDQVLSFALFGFDGLALWHVFSSDFPPKLIESYRRAMRQTVDAHRLLLHYVTLQRTREGKLLYCQDYVEPFEISAARLASMTREQFAGENSYRRLPFHKLQLPRSLIRSLGDKIEADMFQSLEACKKRRGTLKSMLQIPV